MKIYLIDTFGEGVLKAIRELYEEAFPESEKKPFSIILDRRERGLVEILAICGEAGDMLGMAITAMFGDIVLLDYYAIAREARGRGIGTEALKMLQKRYTGRRLILEIEDDAVPADNTADRIRRKRFYLGCGMRLMQYRVLLYSVEMLILTYGGEVSYEEYRGLLSEVFSPQSASNAILLTDR